MTKFLILSLSLLITALQAQKSIVKEIYFEPTKSTISESNKQFLDSLFSTKTLQQIESIQVHGHTDSIGSLSYNEALSQERTDRVCSYLIQKRNHLQALISSNKFGETKPKYEKSEWGHNRRVVLTVNLIQKKLEIPDKDTIITGDCLKIEVEAGTFAPYKNSEVKVKVIVIDSSNIADYAILLRDEAYNPLISGGMFYLQATVNGKPVKQSKNIQACIPANDYPAVLARNMEAYEGIKDKNGNIIWRKTTSSCLLDIVKPINPENKPCDCYKVLFTGNSSFVNCDIGCSESLTANNIPIPKLSDKNAFWTPDEIIAIDFFNDKPQNTEVLYTPKPNIAYKAFPNDMINPPMFQQLRLHRDLVIKCKKEAYDSTKMIRLFIDRRFKNENNREIATSDSQSYSYFEEIAVFAGKMDANQMIHWNKDPVFSGFSDLAHCTYLIFDLPFTGYYKIVDLGAMPEFYSCRIKVKAPRRAEVLVAHNQKNYIHYKLGLYKKRKKQFVISRVYESEKIMLQVSIKRKRSTLNAAVPLSELRYNSNRKMYFLKRKYFSRSKN
jgi:hypothetical protein